jgi:hypothetical protein
MALPFDEDSEDMIKHFQGELRMDQIKTGLSYDVSLIGWRGGLGKKYFAFDDGEMYVNEKNVITSNSALFKNKRKHENLLERALIEKAKAIMFLENDMGNINVALDSLEYEVIFDDSIINDDESKLTQMRQDAQDGVIPLWRYIMNRYKLTKEEAIEWANEAERENGRDVNKLNEKVESGVMSIKDAIRELYPEASEDDITLKYIETKIEQGIPINPKDIEDYKRITGEDLITPQPIIDDVVNTDVDNPVMEQPEIQEDEAQVDTSYNGAQIQSAISIVQAFADGSLSKGSALKMLTEFLRIDDAIAKQMLETGNKPVIE